MRVIMMADAKRLSSTPEEFARDPSQVKAVNLPSLTVNAATTGADSSREQAIVRIGHALFKRWAAFIAADTLGLGSFIWAGRADGRRIPSVSGHTREPFRRVPPPTL